MGPLDATGLTALMERGRGRAEIKVALIDGPVAIDHPDLATQHLMQLPGTIGACSNVKSVACVHGTFVAGILHGRRGSAAPSLCPDCTLLVRPIFSENGTSENEIPSASPEELARAIFESVDAGARVLNMSVGVTRASNKQERRLNEAIDYAAQRGALCVVAAGNQGMISGSTLTSHPWAIPVVACDLRGIPMSVSNLGNSIGRNGLSAPGENITSLGTDGKPSSFAGTSAAAPFVTGTAALLWSEFPSATAASIKLALTKVPRRQRNTIVPPLLNATAAYEALSQAA